MNSTGETAGAAISPLADMTKGWNPNPSLHLLRRSPPPLLLGVYLVERKRAEAEEIKGERNGGEARGVFIRRLYREEERCRGGWSFGIPVSSGVRMQMRCWLFSPFYWNHIFKEG
jgi:hypothetical protein